MDELQTGKDWIVSSGCSNCYTPTSHRAIAHGYCSRQHQSSSPLICRGIEKFSFRELCHRILEQQGQNHEEPEILRKRIRRDQLGQRFFLFSNPPQPGIPFGTVQVSQRQAVRNTVRQQKTWHVMNRDTASQPACGTLSPQVLATGPGKDGHQGEGLVLSEERVQAAGGVTSRTNESRQPRLSRLAR